MGIVGRPVALKIVLSSSRQIEVEPDFDSETLARLVRILERL